MKLIVLALASVVAAILAPVALASSDQHSRSAQVNSLDVDPATVIAGDSTHVSVTLRNPADEAAPKRDLLLRLQTPSLVNAEKNLARAPIGSIPPGGRRTIDLEVGIPVKVVGGEFPLVACRAQRKSPNKCGQSKQQATLNVLDPAGLSLAPATGGFGSRVTGTTSPVQTFTLTNNGDAPSGVPAIAISGDAAQFPLSASTCTAALGGGESCSFDVAFAPTSTGPKNAGVGVVAVPGGGASATLSGTGLAPASLAIAAGSKDFGTHVIGTTSPAQTFTVTNTGEAPSGTITTSVGGGDAGQFTKSADNCNGQTLAPGSSCTVDGAFAPTSGGAKSASLQASASPGGSASAAFSGTGVTPANLTISPTPHNFGDQVIGSTSPTQGFTVTNNGGVPSGSITTGLTGTNSDQFTKSADNCNGQTLGPGASCTLNGAFAPTASGAKSAALQASASPGGAASAPLAGNGLTPANLTITPSSHNFGNVLNGTTVQKTFTITNTGQQTSGDPFVDIPAVVGFSLQSDTCTAGLALNQTCTAVVAFTPIDDGSPPDDYASNLRVFANPGANPPTLAPLSGTGVATAASLRIGLRRFGDSSPVVYGTGGTIGTNSTGLNGVEVWIKNIGAADAHISPATIPITLNNARVTVDNTSSCGVVTGDGFVSEIVFTNTTIAGGSECHIDIEAGHVTPGSWSASFTITGSPGGSITGTVTGI